ncbi:MAG: hypothetical protein DLM73_00180 [Chthoniobacterales bacterium]|nr:MAG: hypothetical protein DLM73_00180 [Chthoniobacterales bacterium]
MARIRSDAGHTYPDVGPLVAEAIQSRANPSLADSKNRERLIQLLLLGLSDDAMTGATRAGRRKQ